MSVKSASLLVSLLCLWSPSAAEENITAEPGQDLTLRCGVPNNNKTIVALKWSRTDLEPDYVLLYRDGHYNQHPSFKNRVDLQDRQMKDGNVSLILKDVTPDDGGRYECRVKQEGTDQGRNGLKTISIIYLAVAPVVPTGPDLLVVFAGVTIGLILLFSIIFTSFCIFKKCARPTPHRPAAEQMDELQQLRISDPGPSQQ